MEKSVKIPNGPRSIVYQWAIKHNLPLDRVGDFIGGFNPQNNPLTKTLMN
ncbi:MAG: hypothetical protein GF317_23740 [Candidatus Lokiarchaeota archaeon]|nr:hypothetical protein [Candidatus Lokiarchaeota archaeon]MBD3202383.1 hypothetical protein [Candidatus Lokiarchaeota archaeon]